MPRLKIKTLMIIVWSVAWYMMGFVNYLRTQDRIKAERQAALQAAALRRAAAASLIPPGGWPRP